MRECSTCRYWLANLDCSPRDARGQCRRYPMTVFADTSQCYPETEADEWCGEYKAGSQHDEYMSMIVDFPNDLFGASSVSFESSCMAHAMIEIGMQLAKKYHERNAAAPMDQLEMCINAAASAVKILEKQRPETPKPEKENKNG